MNRGERVMSESESERGSMCTGRSGSHDHTEQK